MSGITVTMRSGREVSFDTKKIHQAVMKAFDTLYAPPEPDTEYYLKTGSYELIVDIESRHSGSCAIEYFRRFTACMHVFLHDLFHILIHCISLFRKAISDAASFDPRTVVFATVALFVRARVQALGILDHIYSSRRVNLYRRQDRGSNKPASDDDNYILIFA